MLQEAVAENLEVMRGLPPRAIRTAPRRVRVWLRRASLLLVPVTMWGLTRGVEQGSTLPALPQAQIAGAMARLEASTTPNPFPERVTAAAFPLAVRRVVLDAGHGGSDPGATAQNLAEKQITLDIGRRLRTLLENDGFEVIVTRGDDRTIALRDRAKLANESKSDIFVSIHVNSIVKFTDSRGIETYYLGPTNDPSLTKLAAAENGVSGYSLADMRKLLDGIYADARRDESQELAAAVQHKLYGNLRSIDPGLENWGVKRAPFIVLVATEMPAILAEVGCISNQKEAAMLGRPEYRQKIADALFDGIRSYASANDAPRKKGNERNG